MKNYEGIKGDAVEIRQEKNEKCGAFLRISLFLHRHIPMIALVALAVFVVLPDTVFAATTADIMWDSMVVMIKTWVGRLGGVVMFVGGVMFGLGWKNDDAEQKSRGVSTLIAGVIVIAVAGMADTLMKINVT
jgi:hypothetical protein